MNKAKWRESYHKWILSERIKRIRIFQRYEKFMDDTIYSMSTNFDQIGKTRLDESGKIKRMAKIVFLKLFSMIFVIRSFLNVFWPTMLIRQLTCDGFYYLGNPILINLGTLVTTLVGDIICAGIQQYLIFSGQSYELVYINKIKYRRLEYKLNTNFDNKFYRKFNWISRGIAPLFCFTLTFFVISICTPIVLGHFDPETKFTLFGKYKEIK